MFWTSDLQILMPSKKVSNLLDVADCSISGQELHDAIKKKEMRLVIGSPKMNPDSTDS